MFYTNPLDLNILNTLNNLNTLNLLKDTINPYFISPPINYMVKSYENVNVNPNLRQMVTEFYIKKSIKWINTQPGFSKYKKMLSILDKDKGYNIMYNLLREFCHKYNKKWYELREINYNHVKDFLNKKFDTF